MAPTPAESTSPPGTAPRPGRLRRAFGRKARLLYRYKVVHRLAPWSFADDKAYLSFKFFEKFGRPIDLRQPRTFNEKLNWMKLYDRKPLYTRMADKAAAREYVAERVGDRYLNRLIGVYDDVDDIDWDSLPDRFVMRANQGCKFNIICHDRSALDTAAAEAKLRVWMDDNGYFHVREWPYRDIRPRIVCEEFLDGDPKWGLLDYKFFCFAGEPTFVAVDHDRFSHHSQVFYDMDWNEQPFVHGLPKPDERSPRPGCFDEMIGVARTLAAGHPFVRVDLYDHQGQVVFGELTFHPAGSFKPITPAEYDLELGRLVILPSR